MQDILVRWQKLIDKVGCPIACSDIYQVLIESYTDRHRYYHNLTHLRNCFSEFDSICSRLAVPAAVELALWFHDLVYTAGSNCNEDISAAASYAYCLKLYQSSEFSQQVAQMILATKYQRHGYDNNDDTKYLLDIDIAILGYSKLEFLQYEDNIRAENYWLSETEYRKARSGVLSAFIERPFIYTTAYFQDKYEQQARVNIAGLFRVYTS